VKSGAEPRIALVLPSSPRNEPGSEPAGLLRGLCRVWRNRPKRRTDGLVNDLLVRYRRCRRRNSRGGGSLGGRAKLLFRIQPKL
jgi:hypothetical protein